MGQFNAPFAIGMAVYIPNFTWADVCLAFEFSASYDTPLLIFSGWNGVREFSKGKK